MRKHRLEIRMVKTPRNEDQQSSQNDTTLEGKMAHMCYYGERIIVKAGKMALAYVVLDIGRQIVIAKINQPS